MGAAKHRREGFTLIELSIVLVIVGLLIGGILVAQSMIATSRIVAVAAQIQQFDAGVMNFKTKFNALPGDAPAFGGDRNGVVDGRSITNITIFGCEIANFFASISPESYVASPCVSGSGVKALFSGANKNVPTAKLGKANSFFVASAITSPASTCGSDAIDKRNFYAIMDPSQAQVISASYSEYNFVGTSTANSAVRAVDLLALDKKADDGIANAGNVLSGRTYCWGNPASGGIDANPSSGICSSGPTYYVSNSSYECTPLIRIGAQAGDPQ